MLLLLQLLTLPAWAGLMCGLTQTDVEDALTFYGSTGTYQDVVPYVTEPFACFRYGNLCDVVGGTRAPTYVCDVWTDAVAHVPGATLAANADAELDSMADAWEAELFPAGIPDTDPWWGVSPPPSGCSSTVSETDWSDSHKARVKAFWVPTGVYNYIGASTKGYARDSRSVWKKDGTGSVSISADTIRLNSAGSECRLGPFDKSDTDGFVRKIAEYTVGFFIIWPSKYIEATGSYYGITPDVCAAAAWPDPGC